jgi:hypothetical protein
MFHFDGPTVHLELPTKECAVEIESQSQASVILIGSHGTQDDLVDIEFPSVERVAVEVVDSRGQPIRDIMVDVRALDSKPAQVVPGTLWKAAPGNGAGYKPVDTAGIATFVLRHGNYLIQLRHMKERHSLSHVFKGTPDRVIVAPGITRLRIESDRPRQVTITLRSSELPSSWVIEDEVAQQRTVVYGNRVSFWATGGSHKLSFYNDKGAVIGACLVPQGETPWQGEVTVR